MYTDMQEWTEIRRRVLQGGVSKRQILRETGMHWTTLERILSHSEPPGYRVRRLRQGRDEQPVRTLLSEGRRWEVREVQGHRREVVGCDFAVRYGRRESAGGLSDQPWHRYSGP